MADDMIPVGGLEATIRLKTDLEAQLALVLEKLRQTEQKLNAVEAATGKVEGAIRRKASASLDAMAIENQVVNQMLAIYAKEEAAIARTEEALKRKQAAAEAAAIKAANAFIGVIQPTEHATLVESDNAKVAETNRLFKEHEIALRQAANAASGAAREEKYLSDTLEAFAVDASMAETAALHTATAQTAMGNAAYQAQIRSNAMGRGLMQLGFVLDDVQYGFQAVVNNIGPLVSDFATVAGATPVMAGAIGATAQVLGVIGYQAYKHIDDIKALLLEGFEVGPTKGLDRLRSELTEVEKRIDEIQKKGKVYSLEERVSYDDDVRKADALRKAVEQEEALADLERQRPKDERERGSAFIEAIAESGGAKNAIGDLAAALRASADKTTGLSWDTESGTFVSPSDLARREFSRASKGDKDARQRIMEALDSDMMGGRSSISKKIEELSPEKIAADKLKKQQLEDSNWFDEQAADVDREIKRNEEKKERDKEKAERDHERARKENVDIASEQFGRKDGRDIDDLAKREALAISRGKQTEQGARAALANQLVGVGILPDKAAVAAEDLLEKANKKPIEDIAKQVNRENLATAKNLGINVDVERLETLRAIGQGKGTVGGDREALAKRLIDEGKMTEDEANQTLDQLRSQGVGKAIQHLKRLTGEQDREDTKHSQSEVVDTASLTARAQAGVSDGLAESKKQTTLLTKIDTLLSSINAKKTIQIEVD